MWITNEHPGRCTTKAAKQAELRHSTAWLREASHISRLWPQAAFSDMAVWPEKENTLRIPYTLDLLPAPDAKIAKRKPLFICTLLNIHCKNLVFV